MNVSGDCNRRDRILQRQVGLPLHNSGRRMGWRPATSMGGQHYRLSAMLSHAMAALTLGIRLRQTRQQTRQGRCRRPQQHGTQHYGSS
jgi:hypothetical protein